MEWIDLITRLGSWSLAHFWAPTLAWTLASAVLIIAVRAGSSRRASLRVGLLEAMLLSAPLGLVAALAGLGAVVGFESAPADGGTVTILPLSGVLRGAIPGTSGMAGGLSVAALAGLLFLVVFSGCIVRAVTLVAARIRLNRQLEACSIEVPENMLAELDRIRLAMGIRKPVRLVVAGPDQVPMTLGWRRPTIVLPSGLVAESEAARLVLAHELAHVVRADALRHIWAVVAGTLLWFHPLADLMIRRLTALREFLCDALVLSLPDTRRRTYAEVLWSFAVARHKERHRYLIPAMSHTRSELKERIIAMHGTNTLLPKGSAGATLLAASVIFFVSIGFMACSEAATDEAVSDPMMQQSGQSVDGEQAGSEVGESEDATESPVFRVVEEMPQVVGGLADIQTRIKYPEAARAEGVQGMVVVQFVVDKDGNVTSPEVVEGIGSGCDEEALRVVKETRFTPGKQRGQAVAVQLTLPISFKLQ